MKIIWQRLWPELLPYKGRLIGVLLLGAIASALKAMVPELTRRLVEDAWQSADRDLAIQLPLFIVVAWTLSGVARYYHLFGMKYTSDQIAVKLRRRLMDKYLTLNLAFFHSFARGSGGLISRMVNDIGLIQNGTHKVADIVREPFMALFAFAYLIYIDWKLTLFIIVALPFITQIMRSLARSLRKYSRRNQEAMEDLTKTLKESLDGTRIVQSFNLEGEMRNRFNAEAEYFLQTRKKIISREEAAGPLTESFAAFTMSLLLIYFGQQIFAGSLSIADFLGFSVAVSLLQDAIKKIQGGYLKLQETSVALDRLYNIINETSVVPVSTSAKAFPREWDHIEYRNVSFAFGDERVLKNVNLKVKRGEIVAVVGASGGGKSTLVNLLERFFDPTEGDILIGGQPIRDIDLKELRRHVALVTQDVFLFSDTIERNIRMGDLEKSSGDIQSAARAANAHDFISKTPEAYETKVGDHGSRLSGGEKQRISIARAVYKDAPILILDEATSALDSESELEVQKGLDQLMTGRTAFVIAHRLSTIMKADRIIVLKNGEIVEQGSHDELVERQGEYNKFFQLQAGI